MPLTLNSYNRAAEAIDLLQAALDEFQDANNGVLPVSANDALASFIALPRRRRPFRTRREGPRSPSSSIPSTRNNAAG